MPIAPEKRALYPKDWPAIRDRILVRAGHRCERCKVPNHALVARGTDGTYMLEDGDVHSDVDGASLGKARGSEYPTARMVAIVLTVAHVDHDPTHNDDDNLRAWCQKCHLAHDQAEHVASSRATRRKRKAAGDLFADAAPRPLREKEWSADLGTSPWRVCKALALTLERAWPVRFGSGRGFRPRMADRVELARRAFTLHVVDGGERIEIRCKTEQAVRYCAAWHEMLASCEGALPVLVTLTRVE